ncbi:hypothetical protein EfmGK941_19220 [Enterococcus faecium]|nr:hypothetical protein EfmGK941_19220 [Enterococcus faecium]
MKPLDKSDDQLVQVEIPSGSSNKQIGEILEKDNIIKSGIVFNYYTKFKNLTGFQAGYYQLAPNMTLDEIGKQLQEGGKEMNFQGTYSNEQMENKLEEFENFDYVPIGYKKDQLLLKNHQVDETFFNELHQKFPELLESASTLKSSKGKTIVLPVFRYKGLTVTVNSKNATVLKQGGPFVTVKSESGINKVTIRYSYTFFSKISLFISIITLIVLLFYCIKLKIRTSHE